MDRITIQDAARRLGVSEGAVRKRVARKTLEHDKDESGRVYVYLPAGVDDGVDGGQDEGVDPNSNALISHLEEEISYLRDENRRKDEIIMQQAMTMRALGAPDSPREEQHEGQETPGPGPQRSTTPESEATGEGNIERLRRGLWSRIFGA